MWQVSVNPRPRTLDALRILSSFSSPAHIAGERAGDNSQGLLFLQPHRDLISSSRIPKEQFHPTLARGDMSCSMINPSHPEAGRHIFKNWGVDAGAWQTTGIYLGVFSCPRVPPVIKMLPMIKAQS